MKGHRLFLMTMAVLIACPVTAHAAKSAQNGAKCTLSLTKAYTPSAWTGEARYVDQAKHKFLFGAKNLLLGWMELYNEPRESMREAKGFWHGLGTGLVNMLGDTVGGALHLATFPITAFDTPLPEGGTHVL